MFLLDYFPLATAEGPIAMPSPSSVEGSQALLFEDDECAKQSSGLQLQTKCSPKPQSLGQLLPSLPGGNLAALLQPACRLPRAPFAGWSVISTEFGMK